MVALQEKAMSSISPELLAPQCSHRKRAFVRACDDAGFRLQGVRLQEMEGGNKHSCGRCAQVDELLCLTAKLQEDVGILRSS